MRVITTRRGSNRANHRIAEAIADRRAADRRGSDTGDEDRALRAADGD